MMYDVMVAMGPLDMHMQQLCMLATFSAIQEDWAVASMAQFFQSKKVEVSSQKPPLPKHVPAVPKAEPIAAAESLAPFGFTF